VSPSTTKSIHQIVGIGFPLGLSLSGIFVLACRTVGIHSIPTWILALALPTALSGFALFHASCRPVGRDTKRQSINEIQLLVIFPIALLSIYSQRTTVFLALVIGLNLISHLSLGFQSHVPSNLIIYRTIAVFIISAIVTKILFSDGAELFYLASRLGADPLADAAMSKSVSMWGYSDNSFMAGTKNLGYQFAFMMTGLLSSLTPLHEIWIVALVAPFCGLMAIFSSSIHLARKLVLPAQQVSVGILGLALVLQASFPDPFLLTQWPKANNVLGVLLVLLFIHIYISWLDDYKIKVVPVLLVVFFCITITKPQHAMYVIVFTTMHGFIIFTKRKSFRLLYEGFFVSIGLAGTFLVASSFYFSSHGSQEQMRLNFSLYWVTSGLIVFAIRGFVPILSRAKETSDLVKTLRFSAVCSLLVSLLIVAAYDGVNNLNYMFFAALPLIVIINLDFVLTCINKLKMRISYFHTIFVVSAFPAIIFSFSRSVLDTRVTASERFRWLQSLYNSNSLLVYVFLFGASIAVLIVSIVIFGKLEGKRIPISGAVMTVASLAMGSGLFLNQIFDSKIQHAIYGTRSETNDLISKDLFEVAMFLRDHSDDRDVVASNTLCQSAAVALGPTPSPTDRNCWSRNTFAFVSGIASRRNMIDAPIIGTIGSQLSVDAAKRYNVTVQFGSKPTNALLNDLRNYNVRWFVFVNSHLSVNDIDRFGNVRFTNDEYTLLQLNL
jgi:hypothetical protein